MLWSILDAILRFGRGGKDGFGLHFFQVRFRLSRIPFRLRCETIWNHSEQSDSDLFGLSRILLFAVLIPSSGIIPTSDFGLVGFGLSRIRTWSDSDSVRFGLDWIRTSSDPDFEFTFTIDSLKPQVGFRLSWHPRKVGIRLRRNPTFDFFGPVSKSIPTSDFRLRLSSRNRNPTRVRFRQVGIGFRPVGIKSEFGLVESEFGLVESESVHPPSCF